MPNKDDFWSYAVKMFAQPDFAAMCIDLQDTYGTDSNCILLITWQKLSGPAVAWQRVFDLAEDWQDTILRPIRSTRRALKDQDAVLYKQVKTAELSIERHCQEKLLAVFVERGGCVGDCGDDMLEGYLELCGVEDAQSVSQKIISFVA